MRLWELACEFFSLNSAGFLFADLNSCISSCIVARSKDNLEKVAATCRSLLPGGGAANKILLYAGDICSPDDMVAVRELIVRGKLVTPTALYPCSFAPL